MTARIWLNIIQLAPGQVSHRQKMYMCVLLVLVSGRLFCLPSQKMPQWHSFACIKCLKLLSASSKNALFSFQRQNQEDIFKHSEPMCKLLVKFAHPLKKASEAMRIIIYNTLKHINGSVKDL